VAARQIISSFSIFFTFPTDYLFPYTLLASWNDGVVAVVDARQHMSFLQHDTATTPS